MHQRSQSFRYFAENIFRRKGQIYRILPTVECDQINTRMVKFRGKFLFLAFLPATENYELEKNFNLIVKYTNFFRMNV